MRFLMKRCSLCNAYTLSEACPKCGGRTTLPHPPRFSPDDKYLELRSGKPSERS